MRSSPASALVGVLLLVLTKVDPLAGQTPGWVLDSVIDRATGEVVRSVVVGGDKVGTLKPGTAILDVICENHEVSVMLLSPYADMFTHAVEGFVDLQTQRDNGPWVAENWPLKNPFNAEVDGPPAVALAQDLATHTTFTVKGAETATFHIPNKAVLVALLATCKK